MSPGQATWPTYLGIAALGVGLGADTVVVTVRTPGVLGARQVAGRPKQARRTLTIAKHAVAGATGTLLWTTFITVLPIKA